MRVSLLPPFRSPRSDGAVTKQKERTLLGSTLSRQGRGYQIQLRHSGHIDRPIDRYVERDLAVPDPDTITRTADPLCGQGRNVWGDLCTLSVCARDKERRAEEPTGGSAGHSGKTASRAYYICAACGAAGAFRALLSPSLPLSLSPASYRQTNSALILTLPPTSSTYLAVVASRADGGAAALVTTAAFFGPLAVFAIRGRKKSCVMSSANGRRAHVRRSGAPHGLHSV